MRRLATVKRLDQRLNNAYRSVVRACIAPGFEIVRFRYMPMTKFGGLIAMRTEKYFKVDGIRFQGLGEFKFGGRIVGRIATENQQQINLPGTHVFNK